MQQITTKCEGYNTLAIGVQCGFLGVTPNSIALPAEKSTCQCRPLNVRIGSFSRPRRPPSRHVTSRHVTLHRNAETPYFTRCPPKNRTHFFHWIHSESNSSSNLKLGVFGLRAESTASHSLRATNDPRRVTRANDGSVLALNTSTDFRQVLLVPSSHAAFIAAWIPFH